MSGYATVDRRGDKYIVTSSSTTASGYLVSNGWFRIIDAAVIDADTLTAAVLEALSQSSSEVPDPPRDVSPFKPVLDALGLKSFNAYAKGTRSIGVTRDSSGDVKVTPTRNGGAREGFIEITDQAEMVQEGDTNRIGQVVLAAEARSQ